MKKPLLIIFTLFFTFISCNDNTEARLRSNLTYLQKKEEQLIQEREEALSKTKQIEEKLKELSVELDRAKRSGDPAEIKKLEDQISDLKNEANDVLSELEDVKGDLVTTKREVENTEKKLEEEKRKNEATKKAREEVDNLDGLTDDNDPGSKPAFFGYRCEDGKPLTYMEYYYYSVMIHSLFGTFQDPLSEEYTESLSGFQKFLDDSGVIGITAKKLSLYNNDTPANYTKKPEGSKIPTCKSLGISNLMPPKKCWLRSTVLALLTERIAGKLKIKSKNVSVISHYRPSCYNQNIKGASPNSDHILGKSIDIGIVASDSKRVKFKEDVMKTVCDHFWSTDDYRLSVGFGRTKIHLGIDSPRNRSTETGSSRSWSYGGFDLESVKGVNCFEN